MTMKRQNFLTSIFYQSQIGSEALAEHGYITGRRTRLNTDKDIIRENLANLNEFRYPRPDGL